MGQGKALSRGSHSGPEAPLGGRRSSSAVVLVSSNCTDSNRDNISSRVFCNLLRQMVGWHHQLDGHESEQAPGVGDGQGSLACCSPWGHKESDMTERLNWTEPEILEKEKCRDIKNLSSDQLLGHLQLLVTP